MLSIKAKNTGLKFRLLPPKGLFREKPQKRISEKRKAKTRSWQDKTLKAKIQEPNNIQALKEQKQKL